MRINIISTITFVWFLIKLDLWKNYMLFPLYILEIIILTYDCDYDNLYTELTSSVLREILCGTTKARLKLSVKNWIVVKVFEESQNTPSFNFYVKCNCI